MADDTPPPGLVLVVPCYNEASRLAPDAFVRFVAARPSVRLLFVDDGSTDGTVSVLERVCEAVPGSASVLGLARNGGKAEAVRQGLLAALEQRPAYVGYWDADLSTPLDAVDDFLALAARRPDLDVLLGSRVRLMGRDIRRQAWRHYLGRVFATAVSLTLRLPVYDTQCGAKVLRATDTLRGVFVRPFLSRWIFDVEVLARYLDAPVAAGEPGRQTRIFEVALRAWHHAHGSKLRPWDFARAFVDLFAIVRDRP
jgi:glycosyltransferase involved in cell wall biosynthesis